jgi:colanic acid biosynthesis glycosyl transferase WcaI
MEVEKLKVLFWMNSGFDTHSTSEHLLKAVVEQLAKSGNQVHVVQMDQGGQLPKLPEELAQLGVTTDSIPYRAPSKGNFIARYLGAIRYYRSCREALKRHTNSDAVFLQSTNVAIVSARLARKYNRHAKITLNVQDIFPYNAGYSGNINKNGFVFKVMAAFQRRGYKIVDHIITISEDMKDTLVQDGTPAEKIDVIYNWSYQDEPYDQDKLDMTVPDRLFDKRYFNVVYAGNIGVMQNVDILIDAARLMMDDKDVWFHIIGNGVYKDKLEARAKEYGLTNISFWPMQPPESAPSIYTAADVNVIPLVKDVYRTALPSKTATCLACGKPIIFAIGKDSKFGQKAMNEAGCPVVEADQAKDLVAAIHRVMCGETGNKATEFFLTHCRNTENSRKYAKIITGQIAKE